MSIHFLLSASVRLFLGGMLLAGFSACTTIAPQDVSAKDPWQSWNRSVFKFNDLADKNLLRPVSTGYRKYIPSPVRTGVKNFFSNIGDLWGAINKILQGEIKKGLKNTGRFLINSTVGWLGLFDVATPIGIEKSPADFGQTLGRWGVGAGPYLVLPLLGPSTLRDTSALPIDWKANLWNLKTSGDVNTIGTVINVVNTRANLLDATNFVDDSLLDPYTSLRDFYLQRRQTLISPEDDVFEESEPIQESEPIK